MVVMTIINLELPVLNIIPTDMKHSVLSEILVS